MERGRAMGRKAVVRELDLPRDRRLLMMSDIHGNLPFLQQLLKKVKFGEKDTLFLLGDMLEKGKQSLDTLHFIMELTREYDVRPLCGNCDNLVVDFLYGDGGGDEVFYLPYLSHRPESIIRQMGAQYGVEAVKDHGDLARLRDILRRHFAPEMEFLCDLPTVLRSEKLLLVHGGVEDEEHPETLDAWHCMKNDDFRHSGMTFRRTCVVGHWPVTLYDPVKPSAKPLFDEKMNLWSIDGGCVLKLDGQLNALIFEGEGDPNPHYTAYDGLPAVTALDDQPEWADSVNIRWGKSEVEVLEEGKERSLCRHLRTGHTLLILNSYLYRGKDGVMHCEDSTDYRPEIHAGDTLHLVARVEGDALVKKDGVTGWYRGRLAD